jgi:hypothetical protein
MPPPLARSMATPRKIRVVDVHLAGVAMHVERVMSGVVSLVMAAGVLWEVLWACKPHGLEGASTAQPSRSMPSATVAVDALQPLRDFEADRRDSTDFAHFPPSDTMLGSDPYALRRVLLSTQPGTSGAPTSPRFVGLLRGRSAIVALDESLHQTSLLEAPSSASSMAITKEGDVFVAGELSHTIQRFRFAREELRAAGTIDLPDVRAIRGLAAGPEGVLYVIEEHEGRLLTLMLAADERASAKESSPDRSIAFRRFDEPVGHGALRVARVGPYVLVDCLLDHVIVIRRVDRAGVPVTHGEARIVHDGPIWGFDAVEVPKPAGANATLLLAAGGVEDHPLDRTEGSFGFIDQPFIA